MAGRTDRVALGESVYRRMLADLVSGRFPPGSALSETDLVTEYEVSRTPVREALGRLAQDGLLQRSGRNVVVPVRSAREVEDLYEARTALEAAAVGMACRRASTYHLASMRHVQEQADASEDPARTARLHREWHLAVLDASGNAVVSLLLDKLFTAIAVYSSPRMDAAENLDASSREHAEVAAAIADRDEDRARAALVAHLDRVRDLRISAWAQDSTGR